MQLLDDRTCTSLESVAVTVPAAAVVVVVLAGAFSVAPQDSENVWQSAPPYRCPFTVTPLTAKTAFGASIVALNVVPETPWIVSQYWSLNRTWLAVSPPVSFTFSRTGVTQEEMF